MHYPVFLPQSCLCCFRHGAVDLEEEERKRQEERSGAFQGSGFKLGDSEGPSTMVAGAQRTKPVEKVLSPSPFSLSLRSLSPLPLPSPRFEIR